MSFDETQAFFRPDRLPDGNPTSRSTRDGLEYLYDLGLVYMKGDGRGMGWFYDPVAKSWTADEQETQFSVSTATAYDPANGSLYLRANEELVRFEPTTRVWSRVASAPARSGVVYTGTIDTRRRLLWFARPSTSRTWEVWDLARGARVNEEWALDSADDSLFASDAPGVDYDSRADMLVAWSGGVLSRLDLANKTWQRSEAPGAPSASSNGVYGRLRYLREYNVFALAPSTEGNVYFYKNTAGCGP